MAYAAIANLPVQYGLYSCMAPMLVYALLGGSRAMSVSTTSTIATLTATTLVTAGVASGSTAPERDLVGLTLLVGVILLLARLLRLGSLVENINQATLLGVKVGLGATVALGQVPKLLGTDVDMTGHGFIRSLSAVIESISQNGRAFFPELSRSPSWPSSNRHPSPALLAPLLSLLPQATLAAMVFVAVVGLVDIPALVRLAKISPVEFWTAVATALVGLAAGLLLAVATGVVATLVLVLRELNRPRIKVVTPRPARW